ncbi:hypothetical protein PF008_g32758 [Phytophthora fragariae]|uniref:Uncharacterized protein n=1 Tax=Phytophthora fragariae TaxID=53985 RepID=A0A6G0PYY9_9STRA|nr:hypothetical protein PF008_g32758 [Phytophthora fragariae]
MQHAKRELPGGKLIVTSRCPQQRKRLVQTLIMGFTAVTMPNKKSETTRVEVQVPAATTDQELAKLAQEAVKLVVQRSRCYEDEDDQGGQSQCRHSCRWRRPATSSREHDGGCGTVPDGTCSSTKSNTRNSKGSRQHGVGCRTKSSRSSMTPARSRAILGPGMACSSVACHVADGRRQPRTRVVIDLTNE